MNKMFMENVGFHSRQFSSLLHLMSKFQKNPFKNNKKRKKIGKDPLNSEHPISITV